MKLHAKEACQVCPANPNAALQRLGLNVGKWDHVVALAGNPNTGKSTLFNTLTGLRQHTGNWPGKTITRAEGGFVYADRRYKLVDLPGTYSLLSASPDEEVARDFILFGRPDVTIIVADAGRLERNLSLALQVLQITGRAVLCVNLLDDASAHGCSVDLRGLARDLGIPVAGTSARNGEGIKDLLAQVAAVATGEIVCRPSRLDYSVPGLKPALDRILSMLKSTYPDLRHAEWIAWRLLEGDERVRQAVESGELMDLRESSGGAREAHFGTGVPA
jgi:ferrous iron transport protein B